MNAPLKLLVEEPIYDFEYRLDESSRDGEQSLKIKGLYMMAERKNKNGRVYKLHEMEEEVNRYLDGMVRTKRSLGELNHPTSVEINPERACHMITNLKREGNGFVGESKILSSPMGTIVRNLIMDGVQLGISSRALGKLTPAGDHNDVDEFKLICCDVVHDPSVDTAFVNGILESKQWILNNKGELEEVYEQLEKGLGTLPKHNRDTHYRNLITDFIKSL
jgi:hypothetical protein